jgi:hypothetical protein
LIRAALLLLALLLCATAAGAQDVLIRTSLQPSGAAMLGQQVRLYVDVLYPGEMAHPPRIAAPEVEGAQVFRFETQATNISDRVGSASYVGQRFEFDIYPRRAGTLAVPPVQVTLLDLAGDPVGRRLGAALSMEAKVPPGLDPSGPIVAASEVTLDERWEPAAAKELRVGDALTRNVRRRSAGVPGLALANLAFDAPDGVRAYVDPPMIEDRVERGEVTGTRTDRVTYVFERAGRFVIPGVAQPWWDVQAGAAHTLKLPARDIEVAGGADKTGKSGAPWPLIACIGAAAVLLGAALYLGRAWLITRWSDRQNNPVALERAAYRNFRRSCRQPDAIATYRAWRHWDAVRVDRTMSPELAQAVRVLEASLFGNSGWRAADADALRAAASRTRVRHHAALRRSKLPPLNPGAESAW